ncbi:MAG TPA: PIN domain-containing protein [Fibrobacteria bacterium]|nr:PIN domain-containing protein [Fibrobacteria bacterium]
MILLDTDICVEILRGNAKVIRKQDECPEELAVSFMTAAELLYGAENSDHPERGHMLVHRFLVAVPVIQSGDGILNRFAAVKADLKRARRLIPDADIFIGATALEYADALVTGNSRHFSRIDGLVLQDWTR